MRALLLVTFSLFSGFASAQLRTQPRASLSFGAHLEIAKAAEVETVRKMGERLRSGDRSLCGYNRGLSLSKCSRRLLGAYRVHSSEGLRALLDLAVSAALLDRARGLNDRDVNRDLAENFILIAETAHPERFFAVRMKAKGKRDQLEKTQARIAENAALENFRAQVLPLIHSQIARAEAWQLNTRAQRLRVRRWALK